MFAEKTVGVSICSYGSNHKGFGNLLLFTHTHGNVANVYQIKEVIFDCLALNEALVLIVFI